MSIFYLLSRGVFWYGEEWGNEYIESEVFCSEYEASLHECMCGKDCKAKRVTITWKFEG